jgi:hypothetical protein
MGGFVPACHTQTTVEVAKLEAIMSKSYSCETSDPIFGYQEILSTRRLVTQLRSTKTLSPRQARVPHVAEPVIGSSFRRGGNDE